MNIIVTAGDGFIGSYICERLEKDPNNRIFSPNSYFTGKETNKVPNVTYIRGDSYNISKFFNFIPDIVYHLGEYSRVEKVLMILKRYLNITYRERPLFLSFRKK